MAVQGCRAGRRTNVWRRALVMVSAVAGAAGMMAPPAVAAEFNWFVVRDSRYGTTTVAATYYRDTSQETNRVRITTDSARGVMRLEDQAVVRPELLTWIPIAAGECTWLVFSAECDLREPVISLVDVTLGGGDDEVTLISVSDHGSEDNYLSGGAGNDVLRGSAAGEHFDGESGRDVYVGGSGLDDLDYSRFTSPVSVTLDGIANDGRAGEHDNVMPDIEEIITTEGDDVLRGGGSSRALHARGGNDVISGGPEPEELFGFGGDDSIDGRGGGVDRILCGSGHDVVEADATDILGADCEDVELT